MSTTAVSSNLIDKASPQYFQQRSSDLQQLGQALQSGDLAAATKAFGAISNLGRNGPFAGGDSFKINQRQHDFQEIGRALQNGDLAGAQQAFAQLKSSFDHQRSTDPPVAPPVVVTLSSGATSGAPPTPPAGVSGTGSSGSGSGSEITLNLGAVTPGEQITVGISAGANGSEQVTVGVSNQQNQNPEQITLNLSQNSNQQLVLNLLNSSAGSTSQSNGVNVTA